MTESKKIVREEIPEECEATMKALSHKLRVELAVLLIKYGALSFSQITDTLKKEKSTIANHLNKLELGGIVQNYFQKQPDSNEYSFYEITKYGKTIVESLISSYNNYYLGIK